MCDGLEDETTALILSISAVLKYISGTFKLERLVYNTALVEASYYSSQFFLILKYCGILDACLASNSSKVSPLNFHLLMFLL